MYPDVATQSHNAWFIGSCLFSGIMKDGSEKGSGTAPKAIFIISVKTNENVRVP